MLQRKIQNGTINSIVLSNSNHATEVSILLLSISVLSPSTEYRGVVLSLYKYKDDEKIPNTLLFLVVLSSFVKYSLLGSGTLEATQ